MKSLVKCILSAVLFFMVTIPFRSFFHLTGLTEVRPAAVLPPVCGFIMGAAGPLGCAVGNLAADIISGYPKEICIWGFGAQFIYGWLPYKLWFGGKKREMIHFAKAWDVIRYLFIVFLDSMFMAAVLGVILQKHQLGTLLSQDTLVLFFNNLVFNLVLGIPLLILAGVFLDDGKGRALTLNVRFVLIFLMLSILAAAMMGAASYLEMSHFVTDLVSLWNRIYIRVSMVFFLLCGLSICFLLHLEKQITIPIESLAKIAGSYADREALEKGGCRPDGREMAAKCEEIGRCGGETGTLALAFQKMMLDVEQYIADMTQITKEKERIRTELDVAAKLQADMLPDPLHLLHQYEEFDICAKIAPAKEVAGDFYDFFLTDEDHLMFLIADVSGKGVPAALFTVVSKTLLQNLAGHTDSVKDAFETANRALCKNNKNGMFVTAWMGILTLSTGRLVYVNAGHNAPLLKQGEEPYTYGLEKTGFVLAGMEEMQYEQKEVMLKAGDTLFLYTDGVTEAKNKDREMYGEGRLQNILNESWQKGTEELLAAVWEDVTVFQGSEEQFDDITMLAVRYHGCAFKKYTGTAELSCLAEIMEFLDQEFRKHQVPEPAANTVRMVTDEIVSNICYYSGAQFVTVMMKINTAETQKDHQEGQGTKITLVFEDDGTAYNPLDKEKPDLTKGLDEREPGGLGIYLVKKYMDDIRYTYVEHKNRLVVKRIWV